MGNNNETKGTKGTKREAPTTRPEFTGSIVEKMGEKIYFPSCLDERCCSMFFYSDMACPHGNNCKFKHALFLVDLPTKVLRLWWFFGEN